MLRTISSLLSPLLAVFLPCAASAQQVSGDAPQAATAQKATADSIDENVPYGSANGTPLLLDIYKPAGHGSLHPAVVLIHGGGWSDLDKSTMRNMGRYLARSGYVAVSVDYRLFKDKQNQWPAQLDDVQRAVRWLRANAAKYEVNPDHIGAFGHSAGAQLAALLGMEDTRNNTDPALAKYSSKVQAVVDVSGPSDFTTDKRPDSIAFMTAFLGGDYSKNSATWRDASPVFHAEKGDAPFLIFHGIKDESVPIAQAQELFDKLQAAGVPSSFTKIDDFHTFQTPEARRQLATESVAFFNRYLVEPQ